MHTPLLNTVEHGDVRYTVAHKIQGGIQTEHWLQSIATVLWLPQITTCLRKCWDTFTIVEFYSWGQYLLIALGLRQQHYTVHERCSCTATFNTSYGDKLFSRYIRQSNFLIHSHIDHSNLNSKKLPDFTHYPLHGQVDDTLNKLRILWSLQSYVQLFDSGFTQYGHFWHVSPEHMKTFTHHTQLFIVHCIYQNRITKECD